MILSRIILLCSAMVILEPALAADPPTLLFLDVESGPVGAHITLGGLDFGSSGQVSFNGTPATDVPRWTTTRITARIPAGATSGSVVVNNSNGSSGSIQFTVRAGNIYYVSPSGSDNDPGTLAQPWRTPAHAADQLAPGDVLYLRAGTYTGNDSDVSLYLRSANSGQSGNPIVYRAMPGETPVFDGSQASNSNLYISASHTVFSGVSITAAGSQGWASLGDNNRLVDSDVYGNMSDGKTGSGVNVSNGSSDSSIVGCKVHDNGDTTLDHGFYIKGQNLWIAYNDVYNNFGFGLQIYDGTGSSNADVVIEGNRFHNNGLAGLTVNRGAVRARIINNLIYANDKRGILVASTTSDTLIAHNTLYGNGVPTGTPEIHVRNGANIRIRNNIFYATSGWLAVRESGADATFDHNLYWPTSGRLENNGSRVTFDEWRQAGHDGSGAMVDPRLVNPGALDFHLQADSPAIDAGDDALPEADILTIDFEGDLRDDLPDVGADEAGEGAVAPPNDPPATVEGVQRTDVRD